MPRGKPGSTGVCSMDECGNPHRARGYCKKHYVSEWWNPRNEEKLKEYQRRYNEKYPDANREKALRYVASHREESRARAREWRVNNPEKARAQYKRARKRRRAWKAGNTAFRFTDRELQGRLSMFHGCWVCGNEAEEVDHVKPLARGGSHILANLRPICRPCNARKSARWPIPLRTEEVRHLFS